MALQFNRMTPSCFDPSYPSLDVASPADDLAARLLETRTVVAASVKDPHMVKSSERSGKEEFCMKP